MNASERIDQTLKTAIEHATGPGCPPSLGEALRYAIFPGGARVRPRLCLAVSDACGAAEADAAAADGAGAAIELLHCASLIHDDLPCFDDALLRRGKPSVHCAYGERIAVLAGDALIVAAFQTVARSAAGVPDRLPALIDIVGCSVAAPDGIVAGQAWECEPRVPLRRYHQAKTGSLFAAATQAGAAAAGADPGPWSQLGERLGEAYQVADDVRDATADAETLGKPVGVDVALGRPSAVETHGLTGAVARLKGLVRGAISAIPDCPGAADLEALMLQEVERLLPGVSALRVA